MEEEKEVIEEEKKKYINYGRMNKNYRNIPDDCYNPYRDHRSDLFCYTILFPDTMTESKKEEYLIKKRRKDRIKKEAEIKELIKGLNYGKS